MTISTDCIHTVIRFHGLCGALGVARRDPRDRPWLKLGAMALVLSDESPEFLANRLRDESIELCCGDQGSVLGAGARFQVAGILAQTGRRAGDLAVQYRRYLQFHRDAGTDSDSTLDVLCLLLLLGCGQRERLLIPDVTRLQWLQRLLCSASRGTSDSWSALLCASLVPVELEARHLVQLFQVVRGHLVGITGHDNRAVCLTAAILIGTPLSSREQVQRFADLFRAFGSDPQPQLLPMLAMLAPLPFDPADVLEHLELTKESMDSFGLLSQSATDGLLIGGLAAITMLHSTSATNPPLWPIEPGERRDLDCHFHGACLMIAAMSSGLIPEQGVISRVGTTEDAGASAARIISGQLPPSAHGHSD